MIFGRIRRIKKRAKELLRHTRHVRNMREDILEENKLTNLASSEKNLKQAVKTRDYVLIKQSMEAHSANLQGIMLPGSSSSLIENLEVLVVAVTVAMAFRAYFFQPFKIPTGSMKPTLSGIYSRSLDEPGFTDKMPFKLIKFVFTGEWYTEIRAKRSGVAVWYSERGNDRNGRTFFGHPLRHPKDPSAFACIISGDIHKIQSDAYMRNKHTNELKFRHGEYVEKGDLLWSGIVTRGDHLFVNKVSWNFRKPKRSEIMVFTTTGINELEYSPGFARDENGKPLSTHYIKRMVGLPGETVSIREPDLILNGKRIEDPRMESMKAYPDEKYDGYCTEQAKANGYFASRNQQIKLNDNQYLAFGDNTHNSKDSRYWGPVPQNNLVGPAAFVYWPLSRRWGFTK